MPAPLPPLLLSAPAGRRLSVRELSKVRTACGNHYAGLRLTQTVASLA